MGYDAELAMLEIEFQNESVYQYLNVPIAAYRLLLQAPSIGSYVNRVIRPRFTAVRV